MLRQCTEHLKVAQLCLSKISNYTRAIRAMTVNLFKVIDLQGKPIQERSNYSFTPT